MHRFRLIASYSIVLLALSVLLTPQWVLDAAQGRISNLIATTRIVGSSHALDVALVDGSGSQITSISGDTEMPAAAALADNTANPTVPAVGAHIMCWDGSTWDRCTASQITEATHDAAITPASTISTVLMARGKDTSPTSVGADDRAVALWASRDGILHTYAQQYGAWTVSPAALSSNTGCTPASYISAASTNATSTKGSAGQIYQLSVTNTNAALRYFKIYDKATAPTVGTDTPKLRYAVATSGPPFALSWPTGVTFDNGIAWALTTGSADSDTNAVAASELIVNICYK